MTVLTVGAYIRDLVWSCEQLPRSGESITAPTFVEGHGGKAANAATAAARLGATTRFAGCLSTDAAGEAARQHFVAESVDTGAVSYSERAAGCSGIVVDANGQQTVVTWPGCSALYSPAEAAAAATGLSAADVLLIGGEIPPETSLAAAAAAHERVGAIVVCNPSPAQTLDAEPGWTKHVDLLLVNELEAAALLPEPTVRSLEPEAAARRIAASTGVTAVVITLGRAGVAYANGSRSGSIDGHAVEAVDTTGAGDAFAGALAAGLAGGRDLLESLTLANRVAAVSTTHALCAASYPTWSELGLTGPLTAERSS